MPLHFMVSLVKHFITKTKIVERFMKLFRHMCRLLIYYTFGQVVHTL